MTPKMVTNFRRSLSFPDQPPSHKTAKPKKTLHVRSTSLPTRSHPTISHLKDQISDLLSWSVSDSTSRTSASLCQGLTMLKSVHESLDDLLLLPQTRESLREYSTLVEKLLEEFLHFVDVYGMFQSMLLRVREEYSATQIAVRRKEEVKIANHCKNLRKIAKEIGKLVSVVPLTRKSETNSSSFDEEAELINAVNDVVKVTILVSNAVFGGMAGSLAYRRTTTFMGFGRKTKSLVVEGSIREFQEINLEGLKNEDFKMLPKKMLEVEDCMVEIESCGEKVFRSLINTRVSLLNVLTQ